MASVAPSIETCVAIVAKIYEIWKSVKGAKKEMKRFGDMIKMMDWPMKALQRSAKNSAADKDKERKQYLQQIIQDIQPTYEAALDLLQSWTSKQILRHGHSELEFRWRVVADLYHTCIGGTKDTLEELESKLQASKLDIILYLQLYSTKPSQKDSKKAIPQTSKPSVSRPKAAGEKKQIEPAVSPADGDKQAPAKTGAANQKNKAQTQKSTKNKAAAQPSDPGQTAGTQPDLPTAQSSTPKGPSKTQAQKPAPIQKPLILMASPPEPPWPNPSAISKAQKSPKLPHEQLAAPKPIVRTASPRPLSPRPNPSPAPSKSPKATKNGVFDPPDGSGKSKPSQTPASRKAAEQGSGRDPESLPKLSPSKLSPRDSSKAIYLAPKSSQPPTIDPIIRTASPRPRSPRPPPSRDALVPGNA